MMNTAIDEILEFGDEFLNHHKEKEAWSKLSDDEDFKWTMERIEKYADRIDWAKISENRSVQWDIETLDKYKSRINWIELSSSFYGHNRKFYHGNNCLPVVKNKELFLEKFSKYWDWSQVSRHINEIDNHIIDQFLHKWDWKELIDNDDVHWTPEKFKKYQKYIHISKIHDFTKSKLWDQLVQYKFERLKAKILLES